MYRITTSDIEIMSNLQKEVGMKMQCARIFKIILSKNYVYIYLSESIL